MAKSEKKDEVESKTHETPKAASDDKKSKKDAKKEEKKGSVCEQIEDAIDEAQDVFAEAAEDGPGLPEIVEDAVDEKPADKVKTRFEGLLSRDEAVAYFESIVQGLKKGTIQFKQGDDTLVLTPSSHVGVSIKASRKGEKQKVSFKLNWRSAPESDLAITHEED